ncbi:MAG: PKD domain-containing protein [Nitrospirota bacterium]|nr:PKD domain-containing protein [Nitrospirota bacterium]
MHRLFSLPLLRISIVLAFIMLFGPQAAWPFSISEPKAASVHQAGAYISVALELGNLPGVTKVNYFLYREDEDMLKALVEEKLVLVSTAKHTPPFGGKVLLPKEAMGTYRLLAVAEQGGRQSKVALQAIFDEVLIMIVPEAELLAIDFQTNKPLRFGRAGGVRVYDQLDALGTIFQLPVMGEFSDGVTRAIRWHNTGTTYLSGDESVITVNQDGVLRLAGNGATVLTVKNREQVTTLDILVEVNDEPNQPPVADPGKPQSVLAGARVTLNGLMSYDPDGGSLQYHWAQVRGSKIPLLDPYSAQAKFLAPFVSEERTFRFTLRVTDVKGADSQPTAVDIIVSP